MWADPTRRLRRSRRHRLVAGVCGGLADYFGMDATLMRVIYVIFSIMSVAFPGFLAYVVLWIIIPEDGY
jgi:phage shock protein C